MAVAPSAALPTEAPGSAQEVADLLRSCSEEGRRVRIVGGGTKLAWGNPVEADLRLSTAGLTEIVEHDPGDFIAVLQPGLALAEAQAAFAREGQRLSLDPPFGEEEAATVGGVLAAGDAGPMRHRYGAIRDLVIGVVVALPDGTVARAGGKVIKNVAGYDLAKLNAGAFGTLGVLVEVCVRLHPLPEHTASAAASTDDPEVLSRAARRIAHSPLESEALDVAWRKGEGGVLARYAGATAPQQARDAAELLEKEGLQSHVLEEDERPWAQQRAGQRSSEGVVVRVAGLLGDLERVVALAEETGAELVGRAAIGASWLRLAEADAPAVEHTRKALAPHACTVLDAPEDVRAALDPWPALEPGLFALSRRLKERFDPDGVCNPGLFAGGL
ncbi:MAG: FAD-binding oxidoreductase [Solirubrobacteraceae bacterium]